MGIEVIDHYHREDLYQSILSGLKSMGKDVNALSPQDLWIVDQFHVGGAQSTLDLLKRLPVNSDAKVLDVGCGIGGPCRMFAQEFQCEVHGVDLTPIFVEVAGKLSALVNLDHLTNFTQANALDLPFEDGSFDLVWTQHVQMNIARKEKFYGEIARVLNAGGHLVFHDLFQGSCEIDYPVPWAQDQTTSFLFPYARLRTLLSSLGFQEHFHSQENQFAIEFFKQAQDIINESGRPPLGAQIVMGDNAVIKLSNILKNFQNGCLELHQGIFSK